MKEYTIRKIGNTVFVLKTGGRPMDKKTNIPNANFKGTGLACCGVLQKGESLNAWIKKMKNASEVRDVKPKTKKNVKKKVNAYRA